MNFVKDQGFTGEIFMHKKTVIFFIILLCSVSIFAEEIRAIWITRWDYVTKNQVEQIIDNIADHHFNYALFQVRGNGTVFYESELEPWAWELTGPDPSTLGQNPGWNPLEVAIERAHEKGMKILAYMNTYPGWRGTTPPPPQVPQLWNTHRNWFCWDSSGTTMTLSSHYVTLSPGVPEVEDYLTAIYKEMISKYNVDGVHYDYVRYPTSDYSWDPVSLQRFFDQYGGTPETMPSQWDQFRRDLVTGLVERVFNEGKPIKQNMLFTGATWSSYSSGYNSYFQDSWGWIASGIMDVSHPMTYTSSLGTFSSRATEHIEHAADRFVAPGIGAHNIGDVETFIAQVERSRNLGGHGLTVFAYSSLFPDHAPNEKANALLSGKFRFKDDNPRFLWKETEGDDDNTGPRIFNFLTQPDHPATGENFHITCDITDTSGVYDDETSSGGQGIFLRYNVDASPLSATQWVPMHNLSGDTYITDSPLNMPEENSVLYFQVIAYDNDFDASEPGDRARRISAIMDTTPEPAPIYVFDTLFGKTLQLPQYCVVDNHGKLWVCNYTPDEVVVFNPDGTEADFSPITQGLDEFGANVDVDCPSGIAVDPQGTIWVTLDDNYDEPFFQGILKFNAQTGAPIKGTSLYFRPGDLDFDNEGNLFIIHKIVDHWVVYTKQDDYSTTFTFGSGSADHINRGISVTNSGNRVYISSYADGAIHLWNGSVSSGVASYTQGADLCNVSGVSGAVDVDNFGSVFVSDAGAGIVKFFNSEHNLLQTISSSSTPLSTPRGVGFTQTSEYIYIVPFTGSGTVQRWKKYSPAKNAWVSY